jgi:hypothetical protein
MYVPVLPRFLSVHRCQKKIASHYCYKKNVKMISAEAVTHKNQPTTSWFDLI